MPGSALVEIDGARELRASMKRAGEDLTELATLNREAAGVVAVRAGGNAPRRTDTLASTVRFSGTKTAGVVRAGSAKVPYANPIHWGWPKRGIAANPFISEAGTATEPIWTDVYLRGVNRIIDKIKGD
jgi:hypothetical protein